MTPYQREVLGLFVWAVCCAFAFRSLLSAALLCFGGFILVECYKQR